MSKNTPAQESLQLATSDGGSTNVEKYEFEPIKGYPMLNWRGKRPFSSTQYYPAQLKEVHGEEVDGWRNKIFWGDNLQVMSHLLKEFRGKVDLIYIDPPFDSKADYKKTIQLKGKTTSNDQSSFEEKQYTDLWSNDEYLQFMYERLVVARELLSDKGSLFLHCDFHKSHHLRCLLDEIFGNGGADTRGPGYKNEIIWCYSVGGKAKAKFGEKHDTIYWYTKCADWIFNPEGARVPRKPNSHMKLLVDAEGREYQQKIDAKTGKAYIYYMDEGKVAEDYWTDIETLNWEDSERQDYPTQKPEKLLKRIIATCSSPGSIVFDFFAGSGTTQVVAMELGRRFIGADINLGAVQTTAKRLTGSAVGMGQKSLEQGLKCFTGFEVYNVNHYDMFRNPVQAKELLIEALEVQKLEFSTVFDGEKDGRMVKIMPVNRIATRADLNELIAGFDYKSWERKQNESPNRPVEKISLVCMGHEPDLAARLELAAKPFKVDVEVVDILRDKADLEFKRDSQAKVAIKNDELVIEKFFPMNLLQKLSLQKESVVDWKELVESVLIDWNYDGAVLQPAVVDIPGKKDQVKGAYKVPGDAGTIRVKITDLLSESWEGSVSNGE